MKMHTRIPRKQLLITVSSTFAILSILVGAATFGFFGKGSTATHAAGLQQYTPGGTWVLSSNQSPLKPASVIGVAACPSSAVQYNGPNTAYNCHEIVYDGSLHAVWIREGRSGDSGFGIAHFAEHNLMLQSVEDVIESAQQGFQELAGTSGTTRYDYIAGYLDPNTHTVTQNLTVVEERAPSTDSIPQASNDQNELGVVTAFCSGADGTYEQICPDWVNATIGEL
jgi:hypothetical protein